MQGTVSAFDAQTHTGTVLLDDGSEVPFTATAFAASGLHTLRLGQRLRLELEGTGTNRRIGFLNLVTLADDPDLRRRVAPRHG